MRYQDQFISYSKMPSAQLRNLFEKHGDSQAQFMYGSRLIFESGTYGDDIHIQGLHHIHCAAENGCADAEYWMSKELSNREPEKAVQFLKSASLQGHFYAAGALGYIHFHQGDLHNPTEATRIWGAAINNKKKKFPHHGPSHLLGMISNLFSDGAYSLPPQTELAGPLHILSSQKSLSAQKQRDVLLTLTHIKADLPEVFERMKDAGLKWQTQRETATLLLDEVEHMTESSDQIAVRVRRIHICNSLSSVMQSHLDIRKEVGDYLKAKLPPEITKIRNIKFGLDG